MIVFWNIFFQIIPLFIKIFIGFFAGKFLKVDRNSIATIIFYLISPIFFFYSVATSSINLSTVALPIILYVVACIICIASYNLSKFIWSNSTANLLGFTSGNGNAGYFGLPIVIQIFDKEYIGVYITAMLGIILYENSLGFFIAAKKNCTTKEAIIRVLKLPMLHAFFLGCIFSYIKINIPSIFDNFVLNIRGCYSVLGMMLIGLGLASIKNFSLDYKFIFLSLFIRFVLWPGLIFGLISLDRNFFHIYNNDIHNILRLLSIVPLAANTAVIASLLNIHPEKAASAVLISTIFALFYVPFMISNFII